MTRLLSRDRWPAEIDIWRVSLDLSASTEHILFLDSDERMRAARYRRPEDQVRFASTRSALRELIGSYTGVAPADVKFAVSSLGKPELANGELPGLQFNVSHAGEHALIAISRSRAVGVDIEQFDESLDWRAMAKLVCAPAELEDLAACDGPQPIKRFYQCWTAKEALLKHMGIGITECLRALTIDLTGVDRVVVPLASEGVSSFADVSKLAVHWLDDVPKYVGCIAY